MHILNKIKTKLAEGGVIYTLKIIMQKTPKPRFFYFDDTFVIFLKEKDKKSPYFALRVNDITKFQ